MNNRATTKNKRCAALACCLVLAAALPAARAGQEPARVLLRNGATIQAPALHQDEQRLVLDLGFTVLSIPADQSALVQTPDSPSTPGLRQDSLAEFDLQAPAAPTGDFQDRLSQLEQAVVIVATPGGFGAGFVIDPEGLVLTNHHVIHDERNYRVTAFLRREDGKREKQVFEEVELLAFSSLMDCALLRIEPQALEGLSLPALALAPDDTPRAGMPVYAIGNPGLGRKMLDHSVSQGILSSTNRNFKDLLYLQTTAAVNPGNSGGPLLDEQGRVIGLVTFRAIFQEGLAFALPVFYLRHFLENAKAYAPSPGTEGAGFRYLPPGENPLDED